MQVLQRKTSKKLRIELLHEGQFNQLGILVNRLLDHRQDRRVRSPYLISTPDGRAVTASMLRLRFDVARDGVIANALNNDDNFLAEQVRQFQFRDIRPKAASEISDLSHASRLLGHTDKRITEKVYRRTGEVVQPTR